MHKILLILLLISTPVFAQEAEQQKVDLLQKSYQKRVEVLEIQDALLETLLKVPFDKRVYIYPALFEEHSISKKILTHPQILIWKGKKPTKIAPQMQEFAKENLEYLPAKFYPILDPDSWPSENKEGDWHQEVGSLLGDALITPQSGVQLPQTTKTK